MGSQFTIERHPSNNNNMATVFYRFHGGFDFSSSDGNYIVCIDHLKLSVEQVTPEVQVAAVAAYNIYTLRVKECGG